MFAQTALKLVSIIALVAGASAGPIVSRPGTSVAPRGFPSFNHWGGFSSLDNFDNFYGSDNFDGSRSTQVIVHEQEVVCHTERVEIIQQRLVVIQEMARRIITEQICDVETQTIVFQQWHSGLHGFGRDIRRESGHSVGFDSHIASHFGDLVESDGSLTSHDLGFSGHDVGQSTVVVSGSNWNDATSWRSVHDAFGASRDAIHDLQL